MQKKKSLSKKFYRETLKSWHMTRARGVQDKLLFSFLEVIV